MTLETYKVLHIFGVLMVIGGLCALYGLYSAETAPRKSLRMALSIIHGVGMMFVLVSGFGMLARLGITDGFPVWAYVKFGIWFLLGTSMILAKRKASVGPSLVGLWVFLGTLAAYLAIFKPD